MKKIIGLSILILTALDSAEPLVVSPTTHGIIKKIIEEKSKDNSFDFKSIIRQTTLARDLQAADSARSAKANAATMERRRFDKQLGESAAGGGTTSLVSKAGIGSLFSAAFESGALAKESQGTITTFRAQGYGVYQLFNPPRQCPFQDPSCDTPSEITLRGLSFHLSIDNAKKEVTVPATTRVAANTTVPLLGLLGSGGRIAGAGARFAVLKRHIPTGEKEIKEWRDKVTTLGDVSKTRIEALDSLLEAMDAQPTVDAIHKAFAEEFAKVENNLLARLEKRYADNLAILQSKVDKADLGDVVTNYRASVRAFDDAMAKALEPILFKPALTFEYNHQQPANEVPVSNLRIIADKPFWGHSLGSSTAKSPQGLFTLNAALTFYERIPEGLKAGRLRDVQAGLQFSRQVGAAHWDNRPTLSFAGYYQYMKENAVLEFGTTAQTPIVPIPLPKPAVEILNTKGSIGIVQGKIEIPIGKTGVVFPIAISWANRTELIKASGVKGQFGISFDLDKLFAQK